MGAGLLVHYIDWPAGDTPAEDDLNFGKTIADIDQRIRNLKRIDENYSAMYDENEDETKTLNAYKEELLKRLENIKQYNGLECTTLHIGDRKVLLTGGLSWGDAPSNAYEDFDMLASAGVL